MAAAPPAHFLWSSGCLRATDDEVTDSLHVRFDFATLDLVTDLPRRLGEAIAHNELPHICDDRPHEDPAVEVWLQYWLDGELPPGEIEGAAALRLGARSLPGLLALVEERPEVCPLLRTTLSRFDRALGAWLAGWPAAEPPRAGLPRVAGADGAGNGGTRPRAEAPSPQELELQLHVVLSILCEPDGSLRAAVSGGGDAAECFRQSALGWIFKLASLYGLSLQEQPQRVADALGVETSTRLGLSLCSWRDEARVEELLQCPVFRPPEHDLQEFARLWVAEQRPWDQPKDIPHRGAGSSEASPVGEGVRQLLLTEPLAAALQGELLMLPPAPRSAHDRCTPEVVPSPEALADSVGGTGCAPAQEDDVQEELREDMQEHVEEASVDEGLGSAQRIAGVSFFRLKRSADCPTAAFDDPSAFRVAERGTASDSFHCWNTAQETQIVGAARQVLASSTPMAPTGRYRLDLRVLSGVEAEAAHLLEVGLCVKPAAGACLGVGDAGVGRTPGAFERPGGGAFFSFVALMDQLMEGVRLVTEINFDDATVQMRNIPAVGDAAPPTPMGAWLKERERLAIVKARPVGELDCPLFKHQSEHLHDMIGSGTLDGDFATAVLADTGTLCATGRFGDVRPETHEDYHFYVVLPAGMELEIF